MKKSIKLCMLIVVCLIMGGTISAAKSKAVPAAATGNEAFHKGAFYLGGALGLGSGLGFLGGFAFIANAEYAVTDNIGVGGSVGYWSYTSEEYKYSYTTATTTFPYYTTTTASYKYSYSIIPIIVTGAYHFKIGNPKLDLAAGLSLGYYIVNSSVESSVSGLSGFGSASGNGIAWGIFGLVRYFITDRLALRGKLGYGITVIEAGVDFRI